LSALRKDIEYVMKDSFIFICRLYERVSSIPIKTKKDRLGIAKRIARLKEDGFRVRCFRDSPGFLIVAARKPRLDDFF
jgi:hypothetical protein